MAQQPPVNQDLLIIETSRSHSDTPHSVGLLWTSDQPDAYTSTWQSKSLTTDRHLCNPLPPPCRIQTRNFSKKMTAEPRFRMRSHRKWRNSLALCTQNLCIFYFLFCSSSVNKRTRKIPYYERLILFGNRHLRRSQWPARSKTWVCDRSLAEVVGSNPTGGMDIYH